MKLLLRRTLVLWGRRAARQRGNKARVKRTPISNSLVTIDDSRSKRTRVRRNVSLNKESMPGPKNVLLLSTKSQVFSLHCYTVP